MDKIGNIGVIGQGASVDKSKLCLVGKKIDDKRASFVLSEDNTPMVFTDKAAAIRFMLKNGYSLFEIDQFKFYKAEYLITNRLVEVEDEKPS